MLTALIQDLRYALRTLRQTPGVTATAILALALGIGANTAIFTFVKAILLSPLPYPEPDHLAMIMRSYKDNNVPTLSVLKLDYWRRHSQSFEAMTGFEPIGSGYNLVAPGGEPERLLGIRVMGDYFRALGVAPAMGRAFGDEANRIGAVRVAVVSHGLWQRRFGGDPSLLGRHLGLNGQDYEVIGIMPATFRSAPQAEVWIPLQAPVRADDMSNFLLCMGRLRPGTSLEQARSELKTVYANFAREYPKAVNTSESVAVLPAGEVVSSLVGPVLVILLGAVAFVLLIACANVANLLMAKATGRTKEIAIRVCMGATRWRLARQLMVESVLLALGGAAVGFLIGRAGVAVLVSALPLTIPIFDFTPDLRVLAFTVGISLITGMLFGLAPSVQAWHTDVNGMLKESGRSGDTRKRGLVRRVLVGGEVALAVVLVIGAALLIGTVLHLRGVAPGFDSTNVITMQMSVREPRYDDPANLDSLYRHGVQRLEALPGVESAATVTSLPLELGPDFSYAIPGGTNEGGAQWRAITNEYFRVLRIPVLRGRSFAEADSARSTPVIIVNESFAKQNWPRSDGLGERVILHQRQGVDEPPRVVVGVVGDVREKGLSNAAPTVMYLPAGQVPAEVNQAITALLPAHWVIRTKADPRALLPAIRNELRAIAPEHPVSNIRTMEQVAGQSLILQNLSAGLLGVFAGLALLLAAVGVYGVMAYSVGQRTHEIGIRLALGARPVGITRMILGQAGMVALAGVAVGLLAAGALTRTMSSILYGVSATNAFVFAGVGLLLVMVAVLASYVPARRATRVDPVVLLRHE